MASSQNTITLKGEFNRNDVLVNTNLTVDGTSTLKGRLIAGPDSTASGTYASFAIGKSVNATGMYSIAEGYQCTNSKNYSYAWNGVSTTTYNHNNGEGTFNINPKGGTSGFYINDKNLATLLAEAGGSSDILNTDNTFTKTNTFNGLVTTKGGITNTGTLTVGTTSSQKSTTLNGTLDIITSTTPEITVKNTGIQKTTTSSSSGRNLYKTKYSDSNGNSVAEDILWIPANTLTSSYVRRIYALSSDNSIYNDVFVGSVDQSGNATITIGSSGKSNTITALGSISADSVTVDAITDTSKNDNTVATTAFVHNVIKKYLQNILGSDVIS